MARFNEVMNDNQKEPTPPKLSKKEKEEEEALNKIRQEMRVNKRIDKLIYR